MSKIRLYPAGKAMAVLPHEGVSFDDLTDRERRELVTLGVWVEGGRNWALQASDGSVWATADQKGGPIAKVRGKGGRRLGSGRCPLPDDERRRTTSVQLSGVARKNLERMASEQAKATGQRVTISMVLEGMARQAMPT